MPRRTNEIYRRGKYWLAWDQRADGTLRSPYLTSFWHDKAAGRVRSRSTGTAAETDGMIALDRLYLTDAGEAPAYCPGCGRPMARADAYLLANAIADYRLEIGDERESGATIASRLGHVLDYLEAETLTDMSCAIAARPAFAVTFRRWSAKQPILFYNKAREVTKTRVRAPATTEASLAQLAAVLNHAVDQRRSDTRPEWKTLTPKKVNRVRTVRTNVDVITEMLRYAAEPSKRRGALHAFLVGSLCTLARPIAVVGISTDPERGQWRPGADTVDLNPAGRAQNKKVRPRLPVMPLLAEWLESTLRDTEAKKATERTGGWLVNYYGEPVQDVDSSWRAMLVELGLPLEREWKSYLLRHSLATIVRGAGVPLWELQAFMGHSSGSQTETYAVEEAFPGVRRALQALHDDLDSRVPGALHRRGTGAGSNVIPLRRPEMTG